MDTDDSVATAWMWVEMEEGTGEISGNGRYTIKIIIKKFKIPASEPKLSGN